SAARWRTWTRATWPSTAATPPSSGSCSVRRACTPVQVGYFTGRPRTRRPLGCAVRGQWSILSRGVSRTSGRLSGGGHTNLPAELTPFMGRERELSELSRLVNGTRLLSLLGPAGIGKTRLALRLAAMLGRRFADGVWLVQLAPVTDGDLLPAIIAG